MRLTFLLASAAALVLSLGLASAAEPASSSAAPKRAAPGCGAATGACAFGSAPGVCEGVATQCAEKGCAAHAGDLKVRALFGRGVIARRRLTPFPAPPAAREPHVRAPLSQGCAVR